MYLSHCVKHINQTLQQIDGGALNQGDVKELSTFLPRCVTDPRGNFRVPCPNFAFSAARKIQLKSYVPEKNALQSLSVPIVHFRIKVKSTDPANIKSIKLNFDGLFRIDRQPVFFLHTELPGN